MMINKSLESMRNILGMHSRSLTLDTNQVRVLVLLSVYCLTASQELSEARLTQSQLFPSRDGCVLRGSHIRLWMYEHHMSFTAWCPHLNLMPSQKKISCSTGVALIWRMISCHLPSVPWITFFYFALILYMLYFQNE